jgi:ubiquinone/menaquinone biosynthesis C-methylase UbiE
MSEPIPLNDQVRSFWEKEPCGTGRTVTGEHERLTLPWFDRVEEHRYTVEPFIHSVAQFTRHHGKKILEVGVGAGTDHLQWARAGARCHGVDLTDAAIETTRARLAAYGFESKLQRVDAETLPFEDASFDLVYSWGVIHHSENPGKIVAEIRRVLRPDGKFLGMLYGRHSAAAVHAWVTQALLKGRPFRSLADVLWHYAESVGTKAYTVRELQRLFSDFSKVSVKPMITTYDKEGWPRFLSRFFPDSWGWFITVEAIR